MCGGLVCLLNGSKNDKGKGGARWQFALAYNAGRILSYTIAGVLAGSAGQAGFLLRGSIPVQQVFMIAAGPLEGGLLELPARPVGCPQRESPEGCRAWKKA